MKFSALELWRPCLIVSMLAIFGARSAQAQTFGVELHNTLMPASGAMAGVSIARPQDILSGVSANPASLTQFKGTQFSFSGAWAEPTFNLTQTGAIPPVGTSIIDPFSAKSTAQGSAVANIGVTQDFTELGLPVTFGVAFLTTSGIAADFRHVPASNGTNAALLMFSLPVALGVDLTDRLSVGASAAIGIGVLDGPYVGVGGMTLDYGLRGTFGANYRINDCNTIGGYYQTKQSHTFDNAFQLDLGPGQLSSDVAMDLPQNLGIGVANQALCDGRLLLAADFLYKLWDEADLFSAIYDNQFVVQLGSQYSVGKYRLRAGYAWAENPLDPTPGNNIGGIVQPGDIRVVRYTQGLFAAANPHRISGGIGIVDLLPGIDVDLMAGGMFENTEQLGEFTSVSLASYWIGTGLTWRFGRGGCNRNSTPHQWSCN